MTNHSTVEQFLHLRVRGAGVGVARASTGQTITGKDLYQPSPIRGRLWRNTPFRSKHGRLLYKKQSKLNCSSGIP